MGGGKGLGGGGGGVNPARTARRTLSTPSTCRGKQTSHVGAAVADSHNEIGNKWEGLGMRDWH